MCISCEALRINGVLCHEIGCPDSWKNTIHHCKWCGSVFIPEHSHDQFCDPSCAAAYLGFPELDIVV